VSDRRSARRAARVAEPSTDQPPANILMGPCVEVWAGDPDPPLPGGYERPFSSPWWRARRNWRKALDDWFEASGVEPPGHNRQNVARIRYPWSRSYLLSIGGEPLVDYFEGRRPDYPVDGCVMEHETGRAMGGLLNADSPASETRQPSCGKFLRTACQERRPASLKLGPSQPAPPSSAPLTFTGRRGAFGVSWLRRTADTDSEEFFRASLSRAPSRILSTPLRRRIP
jgi:hypothetical protein